MPPIRVPVRQQPLVVEANNLGRSLQRLRDLLKGVTLFDLARPLRRTIEFLQQAVVIEPQTLAANDTLVVALPQQLVLVNTTAGTVTITLPEPDSAPGAMVRVKKLVAAHTVVVGVVGSNMIDGAATISWTQRYRTLSFVSDGEQWHLAAAYWPKAQMPDIDATGSPSAATFLRGDGQWAVPPEFTGWGVVAVTTTSTFSPSGIATLLEATNTITVTLDPTAPGYQVAISNSGTGTVTAIAGASTVTLAANAGVTFISGFGGWRRVS